MRALFRVVCVSLAVLTFQLFTASVAASASAPPAGGEKVTVNDPQLIPLSEPKSAKKGVKWYWYVLGAAVIAGAAAAAGGGGGGSSSSGTGAASGTVTGTW